MTNGIRHRAEQVALVAMSTIGIVVLVADASGWLDGLVDSDALPKVTTAERSTIGESPGRAR